MKTTWRVTLRSHGKAHGKSDDFLQSQNTHCFSAVLARCDGDLNAIRELNLCKDLQQDLKVLESRRDVFLANRWAEAQRDGSLQ